MKRATWTACCAAALVLVGIVVTFLQRSRDAVEPVDAPSTAIFDDKQPVVEPIEAAPPRVEAEVKVPMSKWELALRTEGAPLEQFRGRIVYESTGQGVPWCGVVLRGVGRQVEACRTDADGRFQSNLGFPLASTFVCVTDHRSNGFAAERAIEVKREAGGPEWSVKVRLPPTFVIAGELPQQVEPGKLTASVTLSPSSTESMRLREGGDQWFLRDASMVPPEIENTRERMSQHANQLQRELAQLEIPGPSDKEAKRIEEKRAEIEHWEDFTERRLDEIRSMHPPWEVRLDSEQPIWQGTFHFDSLDGVIAVTPTWVAFGEVAIKFLGNWTEPPSWWVEAELRSSLADAEPIGSSEWLNELAKKPLRMRNLVPGAYTLSLRCAACRDIELPVSVRATERTTLDVQLECAANAGSVRGEITSDSGEPPGDSPYLELFGPDSKSFGRLHFEVPSSTPWKMNFEITDVPEGEYRLWCDAGEFGVRSSQVGKTRAGDFVRLRVLDRPDYIDLGFRVFDAESGAELETFNVDLYGNGNSNSPRGVPSGSIVAQHVPESGQLGWSVTSPGHLCAEGNLVDPTRWGKRDGSKRWIDVHLQRGLSLSCFVWDDDKGLAGATILADGVKVGTTDATGSCALILPQRPKSIDALYRDWRCVGRAPSDFGTLESCATISFRFERKR